MVKKFLSRFGLFFFISAGALSATTPLDLDFVDFGNVSNTNTYVTRRAPATGDEIRLTFNLRNGATPYEPNIVNSFFTIRIYNSSNTLIYERGSVNPTHFTVNGLSGSDFYPGGTTSPRGGLVIRPNINAPAGTDYRIEISGADGAFTLAAISSNNGTLAADNNGLFEVQYSPLSIRYLAAGYDPGSENELKQGNATQFFYDYQVYYPDGLTTLTSGGGSFVPRIYRGCPATCTDVTSEFGISTPTFDGTRWRVSITAGPNAPYNNTPDLTLALARGTPGSSDTLNSGFSFKAIGPTSLPDQIPASLYDGYFKVVPGNPTVTIINRTAGVIGKGDPAGLNYEWRGRLENGVTPVTAAQIASNEWRIRIYNSSNSLVYDSESVPADPPFNVGAPAYNSGTDTWSVNIAARVPAAFATGYYVSIDTISAGPASGLQMVAEQNSIDGNNLDLTTGVFEVSDATLAMTFHSRDPDQTTKNGNQVAYYYSLNYLDGSEFVDAAELGNLSFQVLDNAAADVTSLFNINNTGFGSWGAANCGGAAACWRVNITAGASAPTVTVLSQGYGIQVEKTLANSGPSRTVLPPVNTLSAPLSAGRFRVSPTDLHVIFESPAAPVSVRRGSTDTINYRFRVLYPDGITEEDNDTGYEIRVYRASDNALIETILNPQSGATTGSVLDASSLTYTSGAWQIALTARSDAPVGDYYISVAKLAGAEGDTLPEFASNASVSADPQGNAGLGTNGNVSVVGAELHIVYLPFSQAAIAQETSGSNIQISFNARYENADEEISDAASYSYTICRVAVDCTLTNFNADFYEISPITYNTGAYRFSLAARKSSPAEADYYVKISKAAGFSPDTLAEFNSNSSSVPDTNGNAGLDTSGTFEVENVNLTVQFRKRVMTRYGDHIKRGDQVGVDYFYTVRYPNGTVVLDDDADHVVQVHSSSGLVESSSDASPTRFSFSAPVYVTSADCAPDPSCWQVNVQANNPATIATGYRIAVVKTSGTSGDNFAATFSNAGGQLGAVNGVFEIRNGVLYIVYYEINQNTVRRADSLPVIYKYQIFRPGETNQTSDTNFTVRVYDSLENNVSTLFNITTPVYNAADCGGQGCWSVSVTPPATFTGSDTYHLGVSKPLSGDGALLLAESRSTADNNTPALVAKGLNNPATNPVNEGTFTVIPELIAVWQSRVNAVRERGTQIRNGNTVYGAIYRFNAQTPDGSYQETSDHGYIIRLYDNADTLLETWDINTPGYPKDVLAGTNFDLERFRHDGTSWIFNIRPRPTAPVGTGYYVSVEKAVGATSNTISSVVTSKDNQNLDATDGVFEVTGATLNFPGGGNQQLYNVANAGTAYERKMENFNAGSTMRFLYRVRYDDNTDENTGPHEVGVTDAGNNDVSAQFNISTPTFVGGFWQVDITPNLANRPPPGTGYRISVGKATGIDTLAVSNSAQTFDVTNTSVQVLALTAPLTAPNNMPRNDATGVNLYYRLQIDDNPGTQDSNAGEAANHLFRFYSNNTLIDSRQGGDTGSNVFQVTTPVYAAHTECGGGSCWQVNIRAGNDAPVSNTLGDFIYHIRIAKNGGANQALETRSNTLPNGLNGTPGEFEVTGDTWQIRFTGTSRDTWAAGNQGNTDRCSLLDRCFAKNDPAGITYFFQVYRGNGTIHVGNDTANAGQYQFWVYNDANADVSSDFTISSLNWNGTAHEITLVPNSTDDNFWENYKLGIRRNGANGITFNGPNSDVLSTLPRVVNAPYVPHSGLDRGVAGYNTGTFSVSDLHIVYNGRSVPAIQRTDLTGVDYTFNVINSGSGTNYTTDIPAANIQVWQGANNRTGWFNVSDATYSGGQHTVKIRALTTTPIQTGFYIRVGVNANPTGNSDVAFYARSDAGAANGGLGAPAGNFDVTAAELTVKFTGESKPAENTLERFNASDSITFYWRLYYPDLASQLANAGSGQVVELVDENNLIVPDCTETAVTWNGTQLAWQTTITCGAAATLAETHRLRITKTGGTDGNLVSTASFSNDATSADIWQGGLGVDYLTGGAVAIRPASFNAVWYFGPNSSVLEQADDASARYTFSLFYPDALNTLFTGGDMTGMQVDVRRVSDDSVVESFTTFPSTGTQFSITSITHSGAPDHQYTFYLRTLKETDIGDYYIALSKNAGSTSQDNIVEAVDANTTRRRFGVSNATLNLVSLSLNNLDNAATRTITRGNALASNIEYRFSVRYDNNVADLTGEEQNVDANEYSVAIWLNSGVSDIANHTALFDISPPTGITWDSVNNNWRVEIAARPDTPVTTGSQFYRVEIRKSNGGTSGDTLLPEFSNVDLGTAGRFTVTYAPLTVSFLPPVNPTMERKDLTANLTEFPFEILYPNPVYKLTNANIGGTQIAIQIRQGGTNRSVWFNGLDAADGEVAAPVAAWDAVNSRWRVKVRAKSIIDSATNYARIAANYLVRVSRGNPAAPASDYIENTNAARNSNDASNLGAAGTFAVTPANLYIQYTLRDTAQIRRADGVGTNFFFRLFYKNGTEFNSAVSDDNLSINVARNADDTSATSQFILANPVFGNHGAANCGGAGSCYQWNIRANDVTDPVFFYTVVEKTTGVGAGREDILNPSFAGLSDTPYKSKSVNENVGGIPFAALGATDGIFEVNYENNLTLEYSAKDRESQRKNDSTGITFNYLVTYADTVTEETDDLDYEINVHASDSTIVATKTGNGTSYSMTLGSADWNISDPVYNAVSKWSVNVSALNNAGVAQDYYISIRKNGAIDKIQTPVASQNDPAGALTDGNFDVTNLRIDLASISVVNPVMEQRAADSDRTRFVFNVFNNDSATALTDVSSPAVDPALFTVRVFRTATPDVDVTSEFEPITVNLTGDEYSVDLRALHTSSTGPAFYVTIEYASWGTGAAMIPFSSKTDREFEVTDASLRIVYLNRINNEIEKGDVIGVQYYYRIFYDDGTQFEPGLASFNATGISYRIFDNTDNDITTSGFAIDGGNPTYLAHGTTECTDGNPCWGLTMLAGISVDAGADRYLGITKNSTTGNRDTIDPAFTSKDTGPDAFGSTGLGAVNGRFDVKNAVLRIEYASRTPDQSEKGDTVGITFRFRMFYKNNLEFMHPDGETSLKINLFDSTDTLRSTASNSFLADNEPTFSFAAATGWSVTIRTSLNAIPEPGYYVTIEKSAGSTFSELVEYSSKASITPSVDTLTPGSFGLGLVNGIFEILPAQLNIVYAPLENTARIVQRKEPDLADAITVSFNVFYKNGSEEAVTANRNDYGIRIFDSANTEITSSFDFYNWTTTAFESDGAHLPHQSFNPTDHLRFDNGSTRWQIAFRPRRDAVLGSGIYVTIERATANVVSHPTYAMADYLNPIASNAATTPDVLGNIGLGANGTFEVSGANLTVKYLNTSFDITNATTQNQFERADGIGITYQYRLFYPDGLERDDWNPTLDGFNNAAFAVGQTTSATGFTIDNIVFTAGGFWQARVLATDTADFSVNYRLGIEKGNGTDGDIILPANRAYSDAATGTPVAGGLDTGINTGGEFDVLPATLNIRFVQRNNASAEKGAARALAPEYEFIAFYDDVNVVGEATATRETDDSGYSLEVIDSTDTVIESFSLTGADQVGSNNLFSVSGLLYDTDRYRFTLIPRKASTAAAGYSVRIAKAVGGEGDTVANVSAKLQADGSDAPANTFHRGLAVGADESASLFAITEATLNIKFVQRTSFEIERADTAQIVYQFRLAYDINEDANAALHEFEVGSDEDPSNFNASVHRTSDNSDATTDFAGVTTLWNAGSTLWETSVSAAYSTPEDTYYLRLAKSAAGTSPATFSSHNSNVPSGSLPDYHIGLNPGLVDLTGGDFRVNPATLAIVYSSLNPVSRQVAKLENNVGDTIIYRWKVNYKNGSEETSAADRTSYSLRVLRSAVDVTSGMQFYRWADSQFETATGFSAADHLRYDSGFWEVRLRPSGGAIVQNGYYIEVNRTADTNVPDILPDYASNAPTVPVTGNAGLGDPGGTFEILGAELLVKYHGTSFSAVPAANRFERQDGTGILYYLTLHYNDSPSFDVKTDTSGGTVDGFNVRVLSIANADVTGDFEAPVLEYGNYGAASCGGTLTDCWRITLRSRFDTPVANGYRVDLTKAAGSDGDTVATPRSSVAPSVDTWQGGLGEDLATHNLNGEFEVQPATLRIVWLGRSTTASTSSIERGTAASEAIQYRYRLMYPDLTTEATNTNTNSANYSARIIDGSNTDVSPFFTVSNPVYDATAKWSVDIRARVKNTGGVLTDVANDYSVEIIKSGIPADPDLMNGYAARSSTTPDVNGNQGLGAGLGIGPDQGDFEVTNAALHIVYASRSNASLSRGTSASNTVIRFNVYYPDGTELTPAEETDAASFNPIIRNAAVQDRSSDFSNPLAVTYDTDAYIIDFYALNNAVIEPGYFVEIEKTAGNTGDSLPSYNSNASTTPDSEGNTGLGTGLAPAQGEFEVQGALLNVKYVKTSFDDLTQDNVFERQDGTGITYYFQLYYEDGAVKTDAGVTATDLQITVLNSSDSTDANTTSNFTVATPVYETTTQTWSVDITASKATTTANDYRISVHKLAGTDGDRILAANAKISNEPIGTATDGALGAGIAGGEFEITPATLRIVYLSRENASALPSATAIYRGTNDVQRMRYNFRVLYPDNVTQALAAEIDPTDFVFNIERPGNIDVSSDFQFANAQYDAAADSGNGAWFTEIKAVSTRIPANDFALKIAKTGNVTRPDVLPAYLSDAPVAPVNGNIGLASGLGAGNGSFEVQYAALHAQFLTRGEARIEKDSAPPVRSIYTFRMFYPDGTEETSGTYNVQIRLSGSLADETSFFNVDVPTYVAGEWTFGLDALTNASPNEPVHVRISRSAAGADTLAPLASNYFDAACTDAQNQNCNQALNTGLGVNEGEFEVVEFILRIEFLSRSTSQVQRTLSTTYYYRIFNWKTARDAGSINAAALEDDQATSGLHWITVKNSAGNPVAWRGDTFTPTGTLPSTQEFSVADPVYGADAGCQAAGSCWAVTITSTKDTNRTTGYYISVQKDLVAAGSLGRMIEIESNINVDTPTAPNFNTQSGLGNINGVFEVIPAVLNVRIHGRSLASVARHDGVGTDYYYSLMYPNGTDVDLNSAEAANHSFRVLYDDPVNASQSSNFNTTVPQLINDSSLCGGVATCWSVKVTALAMANLQGGYSIGIAKGSAVSPFDHTNAETDILNHLPALSPLSNYQFSVLQANLLAKFVSIDPPVVSLGETIRFNLRLGYADGTAFNGTLVPSAISPLNLRILRVESRKTPGAEVSDKEQFNIQTPINCDATGACQVSATVTGTNVSKVGDYVEISGLTANGDMIARNDSVTDLGNMGIFTVGKGIQLYQNFPNPFNPAIGQKTEIRFDLVGHDGGITLHIYTVSGVLVKAFKESEIISRQRVFWDGRNDAGMTVASGIYYLVMEAGGYKKTVKIAVIK